MTDTESSEDNSITPSDYSVFSTSRDRVYIVAVNDPEEAEAELKNQIDFEETRPDQRLYYEGSLAKYTDEADRADDIALIND
jgi:hypothetical protein